MASSASANGRTLVHKKSGGMCISFPDVCKTPSPGGPIPIPYPNIARSAKSAKTAKKVKADGNPVCHDGSEFSSSNGDEAGTAGGGVVSSSTRGRARFVTKSFDVKIEGKGAVRSFEYMPQNKDNAP